MHRTARRSFGDNGVPANGNETTTRATEENTMTETPTREGQVAENAEQRGQGICRTCLSPIWNEGGTIQHQQHETGWSDRVKQGGDSLVCFKAIDYRHVPLEGREACIYDIALARGAAE